MDIARLITLGKIDRTVVLEGITFKLVTHQFKDMESAIIEGKVPDPIKLLCSSIEQIDDEVFETPEQKARLLDILKQMQGAAIAKLLEIASGLVDEQNKAMGGLLSKKAST